MLPVPPATYAMLPTTSVPHAAVALVMVVVPAVTPSVEAYCGLVCCDQSVPEAPATKPPPLVAAPVLRTSQTVEADRLIVYVLAFRESCFLRRKPL